jgi:hypothetical protein
MLVAAANEPPAAIKSLRVITPVHLSFPAGSTSYIIKKPRGYNSFVASIIECKAVVREGNRIITTWGKARKPA